MKRFIFLAALLASTPAIAGTKFAAYEGRDTVQEGQGGTRVEAHGVDFWTTGAPPRRYEILGVLSDTRGAGPLHGEAVGSKRVAAQIRERGGQAAILLDQDSQVRGGVVAGGAVMLARRNTTKLLVIRYVD